MNLGPWLVSVRRALPLLMAGVLYLWLFSLVLLS